jgi:hypothetical protein
MKELVAAYLMRCSRAYLRAEPALVARLGHELAGVPDFKLVFAHRGGIFPGFVHDRPSYQSGNDARALPD